MLPRATAHAPYFMWREFVSEQLLPRFIAHRGALQIAPENTLSAMQAAKKHGAAWVECDVMLTQDDVPIIFHDPSLRRTTNGRGKIAKTDYAKIKILDAGCRFDKDFSGEPIPTLEAWLIEAKKLNMGVNLELKPSKGKSTILVKKVVTLLEKHWNLQNCQVLISSFSLKTLTLFKKLSSSSYLLGLNVKRVWKKHREQASALGCYSIHAEFNTIKKRTVERNAEAGLKTLAYVVDDLKIANRLFEIGVTAVFTDNAALFGQQ